MGRSDRIAAHLQIYLQGSWVFDLCGLLSVGEMNVSFARKSEKFYSRRYLGHILKRSKSQTKSVMYGVVQS